MVLGTRKLTQTDSQKHLTNKQFIHNNFESVAENIIQVFWYYMIMMGKVDGFEKGLKLFCFFYTGIYNM